MSGKPLRGLGIVIDLSNKKAKDDLAEWNRELRAAKGFSEDFTEGVDDMAREMREHAKSVGVSAKQLKEMREIASKNRELGEFAKKYGLNAEQIKRMGLEAEEAKTRMQNLKGIMGGLAALGIGAAAKKIGGEMLDLAMKAERTGITFEVMLKSPEKAKETLNMLKEFSDVTPFSDTEAIMAGKQLINAKVPLDQLKQTLTDIGNVAAGSEVPFAELAEIYSKNKMSGIIQGEDVNQLAGRGLPIMEALAQAMGVQTTQVRALASSGAIHFEHLNKAFAIMSKENYPGLMDRLSASAEGLASTFDSKMASLKKTLGMVMLEGLKPLWAVGIQFIDWLQKTPVAMGVLKASLLVIIPVIGTLLVAGLWAAASAAWGAAAGAIGLQIGLAPLIAIIAGVGAAVLAIILVIEDLYVWLTGGESLIGDWIQRTFGIKPEAVIAKIKEIKAYLGEMFQPLINKLGQLWLKIGPLFSAIWKAVKVIGGVIWEIIKFVAPGIGFIFSLVFDFYKFVFSIIFGIVGLVIDAIGWIVEKMTWLIEKSTAIFKAIYNGIKGALGTVWDFLFGDENTKKIVVSGTAGNQTIEARAGGGRINSGDEYIVGEKGPELFRSDRAGTIIPNHALGGGRKSTNITLAPVFNISGVTDPETVANLAMKKLENMLPLIAAELGFGLG